MESLWQIHWFLHAHTLRKGTIKASNKGVEYLVSISLREKVRQLIPCNLFCLELMTSGYRLVHKILEPFGSFAPRISFDIPMGEYLFYLHNAVLSIPI